MPSIAHEPQTHHTAIELTCEACTQTSVHQLVLRCPHCGMTATVPWQASLSGLLDYVALIHDATHDLKRALEETVL